MPQRTPYELDTEQGRFDAWCDINQMQRSTRTLLNVGLELLGRENLTRGQRMAIEIDVKRLEQNLKTSGELQKEIWAMVRSEGDDIERSGRTCPQGQLSGLDEDAYPLLVRDQRRTSSAAMDYVGALPAAALYILVSGAVFAVSAASVALLVRQFSAGTIAYNDNVREKWRAYQRAGCGDPGADQVRCSQILNVDIAKPEPAFKPEIGVAVPWLALAGIGAAAFWFMRKKG